MKKKLPVLLLSILLIFSSGCTSMLHRDFSFSAQHDIPSSSSMVSFSNIADYDSLVEAIDTMVRMCRTEQTFLLQEFSEDIDAQVKAAIRQVQSTPVGSYAISSILYKTSLILNHYELSFSVTYNCSAEDLRGIMPISGKMELKNALTEQLSQFRTKVLFYSETYRTLCEDIDSFIHERYYINPLYAIGLSDYEYKAFPSEEQPDLVELRIRYTEPAVLLRDKIKTTEAKLETILSDAEDLETDIDALLYFHDVLSCASEYDRKTEEDIARAGYILPRTEPFSIYGVLVDGLAVSEGYALAFKELCDRYGITCVLVTGSYLGVNHMWNRVYIEQKWYNVDCSADSLGDGQVGYGFFCVPDNEMPGYVLSASAKPFCKSNQIRQKLVEAGMDPELLITSRYTINPQ